MEKKAKAEAKRIRRIKRKQGGDAGAPSDTPGIDSEMSDIDSEDSDSESETSNTEPATPGESV